MLFKSQSSTQKNARHFQKRGRMFFLENITSYFGKIEALKAISLTVDKGEILFITGSSGAGKTTLLRILAGEIVPIKGRIQCPQGDCRIARVFQDLRLIGKQTCETNLLLSYDPDIYRNRDEFVYDMMEFSRIMGIKDRLHLEIKNSNGGLKQKVAIIRALLSKPDVILLDEPTSSLDFENANKLFDILNLYNIKKGLTVIWASHNRDLVRNFSGRIVHLDQGRLVHSGRACFI
ncbi:MAG: ATP-binding cassette domain-containing protein [Bacteriovoracaceae bacterium]|nr:ATP-binding cassette domain-containing protein [Bacteriovoracaceae bacterium]